MQNLAVETGHNVIIRQEVANVGERIAAQLLDYLIMFSFIMIMTLLTEKIISDNNQGIFMFFMLIPIFFYSVLSEIFMNGQSLGKKALKIKVVKMDGSEATIGSYIVRWIFRLIDVNIFYGLVAIITIAVNGRGQRVGDIVAKTSVISLKRSKRIDDTIYVEVPEDYSLSYTEVELLDDSDIKTIKEVVKHYKKNVSSTIASSMIRKTVGAVKKKTGIETKDVPLVFLQTILKDYNHMHKNNNT